MNDEAKAERRGQMVRGLALARHRRAVAASGGPTWFELPPDDQAGKMAEADEFVEAALASGLMDYGADPTEPQDPETCTHPAAYVYAHAGRLPRENEESGESVPRVVQWMPSPANDGGRRPGEQFSAALGECSACGSLVAQLSTWHPDDSHAGSARTYGSRWVGLYEVGKDEPVDAHSSAEPAHFYTVDADPTDLTDDGLERIARVRTFYPDGRDMSVPYSAGDGARDVEQCLVGELVRYGLRPRSLTRLPDGGFTVSVVG
jgi:hypothetical protein